MVISAFEFATFCRIGRPAIHTLGTTSLYKLGNIGKKVIDQYLALPSLLIARRGREITHRKIGQFQQRFATTFGTLLFYGVGRIKATVERV